MNKIKISIITIVFLFCANIVYAQNKIKVCTMIEPLSVLVRDILGEAKADFEISEIIDSSVDPHSFELSAKKVRLISESKAVFSTTGIEIKLPKVDVVIGDKKKINHGWLNPSSVISSIENIQAQLCTLLGKDRCPKISKESIEKDINDSMIYCSNKFKENQINSVLLEHDNLTEFLNRANVEVVGTLTPIGQHEPTLRHISEAVNKVKNHPIQRIIIDLHNTRQFVTSLESQFKSKVIRLDEVSSKAGSFGYYYRSICDRIVQ